MTILHKILTVVFAILLTTAFGARFASATCGDFNGDDSVSATDSLGVLGAAVGSQSCAFARCDVDNNGVIAATDALAVLRSAVGQTVSMVCPGVAVTEITDLPRATGPVTGDLGAGASLLASVEGEAGQTGIVLGDLSWDTFDHNSSMAACEIANMTRIAMTSAAEADKILCYIQNAFANVDDGSIDIYDGEYHTFALEFTGGPGGGPDGGPDGEHHGGPSIVKMRLAKTGDTITGFELFACEETPGGTIQQNEYISQTISSTDFSMVAKGMFTDPWSGGTNAHQVQVTGDLNDAGQFVGTKLITMSHSSNWADGGSGYGEMSVGQGAANVSLDGYDAGGFSDGTTDYIYSHRVTALAELFDLTAGGEEFEIGNLALGDGAAKVSMRHGEEYSWSDFTQVQGWNGDTTEVDFDASAEFVEIVLDSDLPEVGEVAIAFGDGEAFDCTEQAEAVVPIDMALLDQSCSHLDLDRHWIDCFQLTGGGGGGGGGPGGPCEGPDCGEPCDGPDCGPCEGPDCGGPGDECWDPSCDCNPEDPACVDACWNFDACGDPHPPCEGPDCGAPCEGPDCGGPGDECWDPSCDCNPEDPACVDACWNFDACGDPHPPCEGPDCGPCEGPDCGEPCEGPDCGPPAECWDPSCPCAPEDEGCVEACWNFEECGDPNGPPCEGPDCGPCEGPDCGEPCDGPDCGPPAECWDQSCTCAPEEPGCVEACWDYDTCGDPYGEPPCEGPDCEQPPAP